MDVITLEDRLIAKIREIQETLEEAKSTGVQLNEAQTEFIIIDPLLHVLGYNPLQIYKRGHDSVANNFPDYTLLPNTPQKWFLEVKRLGLNLQDGEAAQAVNYANNQGAEWAVLTNGRTWCIYNAHLQKPLPEKRIVQIVDLFQEEDAAGKLRLLARDSMQSGGLTAAWTQERIRTIVQHQLITPGSAVRKLLRKIGSAEIGTLPDDGAIGRAIVACVSGNLMPGTGAVVLPNAAGTKAHTNGASSPTARLEAATLEETKYRFAEIGKDAALATGRKPKVLEFSDGQQFIVSSWADAATLVVEHIGKGYKLPTLPYISGHKGNNFFLSTDKVHMNGNPMLSFRTVTVGPTTVYIDTKRSAQYLAASVAAFLRDVGASPDAVKVTFK